MPSQERGGDVCEFRLRREGGMSVNITSQERGGDVCVCRLRREERMSVNSVSGERRGHLSENTISVGGGGG